MNTQILSLGRPSVGVSRLLMGAGVLALVATGYAGFQGAPDESAYAANREVEAHVARLPAANLEELTKASDAVVVGRVVASSPTRFILPAGGAPHAFQSSGAPADLPKDKLAGFVAPKEGGPRLADPNIITPPAGLPTTDFTIEVSQVISGKISKGARVTVNQPGGVIQIPLGPGAPTLTRTILAEHDALMVPGQEHVLFLQSAGDGTFHVTSGPDGRFKLDAKRTLQPVDEGSPVGVAHKGQTIEQLAAAVRGIKGLGSVAD